MDTDKDFGKLIIENRKRLVLDGVSHVIGFDESYVSLDTSLGRVVVEGEGMKIESLSRDDGLICITGEISAVFYTEIKGKNGVLRRIFK